MNDPNDTSDVIARSNFSIPHVVHPLALSGAAIAAAARETPDKIRELAIPEASKRRAEQLERAYGGVGIAYKESLPTAGGSTSNRSPSPSTTMIDFNPERVPIRVHREPAPPPSKVPGESKAARRMRRRNLR